MLHLGSRKVGNEEEQRRFERSMHNGSALLRVDATVTSVRIKVSASSFPFLSSFFFISHAEEDAKLSDSTSVSAA